MREIKLGEYKIPEVLLLEYVNKSKMAIELKGFDTTLYFNMHVDLHEIHEQILEIAGTDREDSSFGLALASYVRNFCPDLFF